MRVFISYSNKDGLAPARKARDILKCVGHHVWMYEHDRTLGVSTWREIANSIVCNTDAVVFLCTDSTIQSYGQELEAGYALNNRVKILVLRLGNTSVPPELTARNYGTWAPEKFEERCVELARALPDIVRNTKELDTNSSAKQFPEPMEEHRRYIRQLNSRTANLDSRRVLECENAVWTSYEAATLPRQVARLSEELNIGDPELRRIELWARIKLREFNDPNFRWDSYFADVGRGVASGERNHLQEVIGRQPIAPAATISRSNPQFNVLTQLIEARQDNDVPPDTLLAPVQLEAPFVKHYRDRLEWLPRPWRLRVAGTQVRVFWSHRYAPLDRFILFGSRAGTWHVVPDEKTGRALTIALGQLELYTDEVAFGVETVVRYEVTRPDGFSTISLTA